MVGDLNRLVSANIMTSCKVASLLFQRQPRLVQRNTEVSFYRALLGGLLAVLSSLSNQMPLF